jgi:2-phosphosulfolactate phosphatase
MKLDLAGISAICEKLLIDLVTSTIEWYFDSLQSMCNQLVKLFTYHTPELTPTDKVPDCAIALDILRATTTIATALHAGAEAVQAFSDMEQLMQVSEGWPADKRLRAGERGGAMVAGCDLGNSPLDARPNE